MASLWGDIQGFLGNAFGGAGQAVQNVEQGAGNALGAIGNAAQHLDQAARGTSIVPWNAPVSAVQNVGNGLVGMVNSAMPAIGAASDIVGLPQAYLSGHPQLISSTQQNLGQNLQQWGQQQQQVNQAIATPFQVRNPKTGQMVWNNSPQAKLRDQTISSMVMGAETGPTAVPEEGAARAAAQAADLDKLDAMERAGKANTPEYKAALDQVAKKYGNQNVARPQADLQAQIEAAHKAGNTALETKLNAQLTDSGLRSPGATPTEDPFKAQIAQAQAKLDRLHQVEAESDKLGRRLDRTAKMVKSGTEPTSSPQTFVKFADQQLAAPESEIRKVTGESPALKATEGVSPYKLRAGQGVPAKLITDADRQQAHLTFSTPEQVVGRRLVAQRDLAAEQRASDTLASGGSLEDAVKAYQAEHPGITAKDATYRVKLMARQTKQPITARIPNPERGQHDIAIAKPGDYEQAPINKKIVSNTLGRLNDKAQRALTALSEEDRANFQDYLEKTKPIEDAKDPAKVRQAIAASTKLTDTANEFDRNVFGNTPHIQDYFPEYVDRAGMEERDQLQTEQNLEEEMGTQAWQKLSQNEKNDLVNERMGDMTVQTHREDANYGGFRNQRREFRNRQELLQAGYKPLYADPREALTRYTQGAQKVIGDQAFKKAAAEADVEEGNKGIGGTVRYGTFDGDRIDLSKKGYNALKHTDINYGNRGVLAQGFDRMMRPIIQTIVINPAIHGENLAFQELVHSGNMPLLPGREGFLGKIPAGPIGMLRSFGNFARIAFNPGERELAYDRYLGDGGHIPTYGKNDVTLITKALDGVNIPRVNKLNASAMSGLDGLFRVTAHEADVRSGIDPETSIRQIDQFLGDDKHVNTVAQNMVMFAHWIKTQGTTLYSLVRHPVQNAGATANFLTLAAVWYGLNKAYQAFTGNNQASVRAPGALGLVKQIGEVPGQVQQGQSLSLIVSHFNPAIEAAMNQLYGKDLYSGKALSTPQDRAGNAIDTLFGQSQNIQNVTSGKRTPLETLTNIGLGLYTPHIQGTDAAPALTGSLGALYNQPGATADTNQRYQDVKAYVSAIQGAINSSSPNDQAVINKYLSRELTPDGQKISPGTVGGYNNAKDLIDNANLGGHALENLYHAEHSLSNTDPLWKLPLNAPEGKPSVTNYMKVQSQYEGNEKDGMKIREQGSLTKGWITDLQQRRTAYYASLPPSKSAPAREPAYPTFDSQTTTDMKKVDSITDGKQFSAYLSSHPDVTDAFATIAHWTNQIRQLEGGPPLPQTQQASPQLQQIINTYNALPPSKSAGNTNPATNHMRANWIKANPQAYDKMIQFFAQSSMNSLLKNAITAVYSGQSQAYQPLLKNVKNVGPDIYQNPDGTYSLNAPAANAAAYAARSKSKGSGRVNIRLSANFQKNKLKVQTPRHVRIQLARNYLQGAKIKAKVPRPGRQPGLPIATF